MLTVAPRPNAGAAVAEHEPVAPGDASARDERSAIAPGTLVGRYVVLDRLGAGGAGTVYAAYDPVLDRRVALKVLHRAPAGHEDLLTREAQAMAKLAHPNVVHVHDVGAFTGGAFIAMEHVDGRTLRAWLSERTRSVRAILGVMQGAGRGLAAAHAAGLVHRDFKPENVLVDGEERARVTDFGLARAPIESVAIIDARPDGPTTAAVGTPAYMAPEQRAGRRPDARSDQYAFALTLHEALTGRVPDDAVDSTLPTRLRRVLARALATRDDRYPTMDALLRDLDAASRSPWRRVAPFVFAAATFAFGAAALRPLTVTSPVTACRAGASAIDAVWTDARRAEVEHAFVVSGRPFSGAAFATTDRLVTDYVRAWTTSHADACEATHVRRAQSAPLLDLRMACLEERRRDVSALVDVLAHADATVVTNAVRAAESLPPVSRCDDTQQLLRPTLQPSPEIAKVVDAHRERLRALRAMASTGQYKRALPEVTEISAAATGIGFRPLEAEALLGLGFLETSTGESARAEGTLRRALFAADAGGDDRLRATIALRLMQLMAVLGKAPAEGPSLAAIVKASIARLTAQGGEEPLLECELASAEGVLAIATNRPEDAVASFTRALPLRERLDGVESRGLASLHYELARAEVLLGRYDEAMPHYQRALAMGEKILGPSHDLVGTVWSGIGGVELDRGHFHEAEVALERSVSVQSAALGDDHLLVAYALSILAMAHVHAGQPDAATAPAERAIAIFQKRGRPDHPNMFYALRALGSAALARGDAVGAAQTLERALTFKPASPVDRAEVEFALARALRRLGRDPGRVAELAARAGEIFEKEASCPLEERTRDSIRAFRGTSGGVVLASRGAPR